MTDEWKKISKKYRPAHFSPAISIRRNGGIALSVDFIRMANIGDCRKVTLFLSSDGMKLAMRFHNDEHDDDAFIVAQDGGGRGSAYGKFISARNLITQSAVLRSLINEDSRARRYEPQRGDGGRWIISFAPSFEKIVHRILELPDGPTGIYRYVRGQEIIYIGRGNFRDRAMLKEREHWDFDKIEYSILNDPEAEKKWETFWLNEFRRKNGSWPRHNKVGGIVDKVVGEDGPS